MAVALLLGQAAGFNSAPQSAHVGFWKQVPRFCEVFNRLVLIYCCLDI